MFDVATLELADGEIPQKPKSLIFDRNDNGQSNEQRLTSMLMAGKVTVCGSLSLLGKAGYITPMVTVYQVINPENPEGAIIKGWSLILGDKKYLGKVFGLHYVDSARKDKPQAVAIPNLMIYFVCEGDPSLVDEDTDQNELLAVFRFVLPFISDVGPPSEMMEALESESSQ